MSGNGTVELHGTASEPVTVTVTAMPLGGAGATVTATSDECYPLLALPLRGLLPGQPYRIEVEAREPGGEVTRASVGLPATAPIADSGAAELTIPIELVDCGRGDSTGAAICRAGAPAGMPLTFAVPLPRGALREPAARVSFAGPAADPDGAGGAGAGARALAGRERALGATGRRPPRWSAAGVRRGAARRGGRRGSGRRRRPDLESG